QLAESASPPPLLFARGRRELLARPMLAVVGSRAATPQGKRNAEDFASALAGHGYAVVSGLASGIDAAAHQGALPHPASTIAVIGTGIDRVYPASNRQLAHRIAAEGLILSEFPLGMGPLPGHFPRRNRVIAGLARGCLVVEAGTASGSLITARLAMENNRDVMAIPGSIHSAQARGCHRLIKDGARLVESVDDVLDEIGRLAAAPPAAGSREAPDAPPLLRGMGWEPVLAESLAGTLGLTPGEVYAMLLELELSGQVASLPGGRFQRLAQL
ncbi:DNA-processing protein DprA, partial [Chromobacterium phragmitis]